MKNRLFYAIFIMVLAAETVILAVFAAVAPDISQDTVAVNEAVQSVAEDFYSLGSHTDSTRLDYVVLDKEGKVLYKTGSGLSESINSAVAHRDTILDIEIGGEVVGKIIIYNDGAQTLQTLKRTVMTVSAVAIIIECGVCIGYAVYVHLSIIRPFRRLKGFAERVAAGNLDFPLEMDRGNIFGAFTESFDIMRSELKKARIAEARALQSKKELVAKLSHDIKTPVASIKAVAEVGLARTNNSKDNENYSQIIVKADQINALVTNLFTATLEELQQLTVSPTHIESGEIGAMLAGSDYLHRAALPDIPQCLVYADGLRLRQVFDNIFANSYKYANSDVFVTASLGDDRLYITVEDCGGGVNAEELPSLKEKFRRGSNAALVEGAGLGLYISDYFMRGMGGELTVENGEHGLKVTVAIALGGKI